jgi:hypothetical protein
MKAVCVCGATAELTPEEQRQAQGGVGLACPYCGGTMRIAASKVQRAAPLTKECPACAEAVPVTSTRCRFCGEDLVAGDAWGRPPAAAGRGGYQSPRRGGHQRGSSAGPIEVCLLVSAIANIIFGLFWATTLIGIIFTVPMVILCVFEFSLHGKLKRLTDAELAHQARTIAIFEIIVGLANTITLVCGIINLVNANRLADETGR